MKKIINCILTFSFLILTFNSCVSTETETKVPEKKEVVKSAEDLEYERATQELEGETVSRDTYEKDKRIILEKIRDLNLIMKSRDYKSWLKFIEPNSINYWSQRKNLSSASKQLPVKGIQLKSLEDYFNYVFIPSRMGRQIDEIRYISSSSIKAVQVREDNTVIFYNFKKINDEWFVELPTL